MEPVSILAVAALPQLLISILLSPWHFAHFIADGVVSDLGCNDAFAVLGIAATMSVSYILQDDREVVQPAAVAFCALALLTLLDGALMCHAFDPVKALSAVMEDFALRTGKV